MDVVIDEQTEIEPEAPVVAEIEPREVAPDEVLAEGELPDGAVVEAVVEAVDAAAEADTAEAPTMRARAWTAVMIVEGEPSSDGRVFTNLTWRDLPLTLQWQKETSHGGMQAGGEVPVGRIDAIARDGNIIRGSGVLDLDSEDGAEVVRLIENGILKGVSIEGAPNDGTIEYDEENDLLLIDGAEIGSLAIVPFPAFRDAVIELGDEIEAAALGAPVVASAASADAPPREWFENPNLERRTGLHVEDNGRVWGHIYGWGECHTGNQRRCVSVPRGGSYEYIVGVDGRGVLCSDGTLVQTGPITISADHANVHLPWLQAKDHYAHTGLAAADVTCGEDEYGIWVAGMVRPGTSREMIHALRASGPSGDWRPIGGKLKLIAILSVNTQGFPALVASYAGGEIEALIVRGEDPDQHASACSCGGNGGSEAVAALLEQMRRFEASVGPVVARMRAEQAAQIAAELDALEPVPGPARRPLAELIQGP